MAAASGSVGDVAFLDRGDGARIAYVRSPGRAPGLMFLGGFNSDMTGAKATALEAFAQARGQAFLRFDYQGHGRSTGRFEDGTIGTWRDDALAALDRLTEGPQVLVGSSMGGWIMLLLALARPERIAGLVGVAAAPDFTEDRMWARFPDTVKAQLRDTGVYHRPSSYSETPYPITLRLIEDGRNHLVLRSPLSLGVPLRLLHGMNDPDVPYEVSLAIARHVEAADVQVRLIKAGDHRLSTPADLAVLTGTVAELLDRC